jgi:hypothetical protein
VLGDSDGVKLGAKDGCSEGMVDGVTSVGKELGTKLEYSEGIGLGMDVGKN